MRGEQASSTSFLLGPLSIWVTSKRVHLIQGRVISFQVILPGYELTDLLSDILLADSQIQSSLAVEMNHHRLLH